jgi:hypothetical protein
MKLYVICSCVRIYLFGPSFGGVVRHPRAKPTYMPSRLMAAVGVSGFAQHPNGRLYGYGRYLRRLSQRRFRYHWRYLQTA